MEQIGYGPPRDDADLRAYLEIGFQSLVGSPAPTEADFVDKWKARTLPHGRARLAVVGGAVAAGLLDLDLGIWIAGRSVPMGGVNFVATATEHRGRKVAGEMMRAYVRELHARGVALSGLYPATMPVYRSAGYELAGCYGWHRIPTATLRARAGELSVRRATPGDREAMKALYDPRARRTNGMLDRSPWIWARILEPVRGGPAYVYVVEAPGGGEGGGIEGYISFLQQPTPGAALGYELSVLDACASTARGHRALLAVIASHRSMATGAILRVGPADPLLTLLEEQAPKGREWQLDWMLRITHLPAAMAARGWPRALRSELHLEVADDVIPENAGRWLVEIGGGEARARRGGEGRLCADVRALASLYSSYLSPFDLARLGKLEADEASLEAAAEAFAGATPWMCDMF